MGSGGSIAESTSPKGDPFDYKNVEKLLKRGELRREADHSGALEEIIKSGHLDSLELILNMGDIRKLHPLHLAARYGKLEVVELLISAGFDYYSCNSKNQLPLHLCAFNKSPESALCATLLCIQGPRALKYRDVNGSVFQTLRRLFNWLLVPTRSPIHCIEYAIFFIGMLKGQKFNI